MCINTQLKIVQDKHNMYLIKWAKNYSGQLFKEMIFAFFWKTKLYIYDQFLKI